MKDRLYKLGLSIGFGEGADQGGTVNLSEIVDLDDELSEAEIETALYKYVREWSHEYIETWFQEVSIDHQITS